MAAIHVDLTGQPHTVCIYLIACSVEGKLYMLLACRSMHLDFLVGLCGCQLPRCWTNGMRYLSLLSHVPISIGFHLHMMKTSFSLWTVTPSFVKTEMVHVLDVFPTLMRECGKSSKVSASAALNGYLGSVIT